MLLLIFDISTTVMKKKIFQLKLNSAAVCTCIRLGQDE